jgi:hypothetical protein
MTNSYGKLPVGVMQEIRSRHSLLDRQFSLPGRMRPHKRLFSAGDSHCRVCVKQRVLQQVGGLLANANMKTVAATPGWTLPLRTASLTAL